MHYRGAGRINDSNEPSVGQIAQRSSAQRAGCGASRKGREIGGRNLIPNLSLGCLPNVAGSVCSQLLVVFEKFVLEQIIQRFPLTAPLRGEQRAADIVPHAE